MWKLSTGWSGALRSPPRVRVLGVAGPARGFLDRAQGVEELPRERVRDPSASAAPAPARVRRGSHPGGCGGSMPCC